MTSEPAFAPALPAPPPRVVPPPARGVTMTAMRRAARKRGLFHENGRRLTTFRTGDNDQQVCEVVVYRRGGPGCHRLRYSAEADLDQCFTGTDAWWDSTRATLAAVAEARAIRAAFPELRDWRLPDEPPAAVVPAVGRVA